MDITQILSQAGISSVDIGKPTVEARGFSRDQPKLIKELIFGPSGAGKTLHLLGALLNGEKVFVIASDLGGEGLAAVTTELDRMGRPEVYEQQLTCVETLDYLEAIKILRHPEVYPQWGPATVACLDGYSGIHMVGVDEYRSPPETVDAKPKAESASWDYWRDVKKASTWLLNRFLLAAKDKHRIVTCLQSTEDKEFSGKKMQGPLVQGSARDLIAPAFDL